jgi:N-acetylmuramoyl-L-alanine amidase
MRMTAITLAAALLMVTSATADEGAGAFRVVIDPGHGGSNTGAPAPRLGSYEKRVTLAVARTLAEELRGRGFAVVMTRTRSRSVRYSSRVRRANAAGADCFVSLHTNATGDGSRRGVETWVLAREAAEVEARRAAHHESDDVQAMLTELQRLEAQRVGGLLAQAIQAQLPAAMGTTDRGVRQFGYDVLAGVAMPAVLVEMGFLDHPVEGAALLDRAGQRRAAAAIAAGIAQFAEQVRGGQKLVMSAAHATRRTTTR